MNLGDRMKAYGTMLISKIDKVVSNFNYDSLRELVGLSLKR